MSVQILALLIFGMGHPAREPLDPSKALPLTSRIPCDGYGAPEDLLRLQTTFSPGASAREFVVSQYQMDKCSVETMFQCWHKSRAGWHDVWSATSAQPSGAAQLPLSSCYEWGSNEPAKYVLSGWYQEVAPNSKTAWRQGLIKQVSSEPAVYEFTDPNGGTARLVIGR